VFTNIAESAKLVLGGLKDHFVGVFTLDEEQMNRGNAKIMEFGARLGSGKFQSARV